MVLIGDELPGDQGYLFHAFDALLVLGVVHHRVVAEEQTIQHLSAVEHAFVLPSRQSLENIQRFACVFHGQLFFLFPVHKSI